MKKLTGIFDIGKTNKKFFLFDDEYREVYKTYARFDEIKDLDGYPCDDIDAIEDWILSTIKATISEYGDSIGAINFSTYGASFVHVDKDGKRLMPLINYLKPYPEELLSQFYQKYGPKYKIARETASPQLGMLNAGMQLYWLKYMHPEIFDQVRWSIHFPQYISYLFTGIPVSEYTSLGCHTGMWDFEKQDYHQWIYDEGIDEKLPPIVTTDTSLFTYALDRKMKIGVGVHDSSSALYPYLRVNKKPFLLISTGTWSITLNPYNTEILSDEDLLNDSLNFMRSDGGAVKAARLFLGKEYSYQVSELQAFFNMAKDAHKSVLFNQTIYDSLIQDKKIIYHLDYLNIERDQPEKTDFSQFINFETAYHQLFIELVDIQLQAVYRAIGNTKITKIFIDGGFADNDLFIKMLSIRLPEMKIRVTKSPLGSALGAALALSDVRVKKKFLKKNFGMKKINSSSDLEIV